MQICIDATISFAKRYATEAKRLAASLLKRFGKRISHVIADNQYYSAEVFRTIRSFGAEPIIPHPLNVKEPLINLYITKRFKVKGDPRLVELYKLKMAVERAFKAGKRELMMENLGWRGIAKVRMHTAIGYACILAVAITPHKIGRPDLANSIATFTYSLPKIAPFTEKSQKRIIQRTLAGAIRGGM